MSEDQALHPQQDSAHRPDVLDTLRENTPQLMKDNAPRVVAGLKIAGAGTMLLSQNRMYNLAGAGFLAGNGIIAVYGGKKSEEEKARLRDAQARKGEPTGVVSRYTSRLLSPDKYPLESAAALGMITSSVLSASGFVGGQGRSPGKMVAGALSLGADANIVFNQENIHADSNNYRSGSFSYFLQELQNRPVMVSSLLDAGCDIAHVVGGGHEYFFKGKEPHTMIAGGLLLLGNAYQAAYVNKNDYNIEAQPDTKEELPAEVMAVPVAVIDTAGLEHGRMQHAAAALQR
jgi:hypothetical protein